MEIFAKGICFDKLIWIFIIGSIFGAFYEEILTMINNYKKYKIFMWEPRRGVFYGPISPIYGLGAIVMVIFLVNNSLTPFITFLVASLLGGTVEYLISFLQEKFIGTISWDYKNQILNIKGRTTIPFMLFWGLLGILFTNIFYPFISDLIESIPINIGNNITNLLLSFLLIDMLVSWTALIRQNMRHKNISPYTKIGEICDQYYNDNYIEKKFPNMKNIKKAQVK